MKERPILFSAPMVRAILEGRKTQTRRVAKGTRAEGVSRCHWSGTGWAHLAAHGGCTCQPVACPYGKPGDRLWVREAWAVQHEYDAFAPSEIGASARWHYAATEDLGGLRKRPSIFLPRRGSRITLEITDVRVERLQEISDADALAEGCDSGHNFGDGSACTAFGMLWESINGPKSWDANPWVWVVEFRRVEVGP